MGCFVPVSYTHLDVYKRQVLHAVLVFDSHLALSVLQQLVLSRVVPLYPRLTRRPYNLPLSAGAGHCWLPDNNFDIDRHVFHGSPLIKTEADLQVTLKLFTLFHLG